MGKDKIMGKVLGVGLVLALIGTMVGGLPASVKEVQASPGIIWVNTTGWWPDGGNFTPSTTPIQAAVNNATSGDVIIVKDGNYTENVDVNTADLTIKSENGAEATIVQAANPVDAVFEITADYVTIEGFTVKGPTEMGRRGIALAQAEHCYISNNTVSNTDFGVWLYLSSNNTVTQNTALNNGATGIHLLFSPDNILTNNVASNNWQGIYLYSSPNNSLTNNTMLENQRNFFVEGWELSSFIQSIDTSNEVNGRPIQYLVGKNNLLIEPSWDIGYLGIVNCTEITVKGLTLNNNNGQGVLLAFSSHSRIESINVSSNLWGIDVCCSSYNTIANNTASNNIYGIRLYLSSDNTVIGNTASNNVNGIYLYYHCSNNTITNNNANLNNGGGICLESSSNNTITDNNASNNYYGIWPESSSNNTITSNNASNNSLGIYLTSSSSNTITDNNASSNYYGIFLYSSSNNTITDNNASNNYYGIYLAYSSNLIYNNCFNNTNNAYDNGNNTWNITKTAGINIIGGPYLGGNYWGDYNGSDTDGDGLGDTLLPYNSQGNIMTGGDYHPLSVAVGVYPTTGLVTTESGGNDTFVVVLSWEPTADVTVGLSSNDTTEGTVSPTSVTFTNLTWNRTQTVTVTGVDDSILDGDIAYLIITAPAVSADARYNGYDALDVNVTNLDDELIKIAAAGGGGVAPRAPEPASFSASYLQISPQQVSLNQPVTISINIANIGGTSGSHTVTLYINSNAEQSQTVSVSPGSTQNVVFTVTRATPGTYLVTVEGQSGQFVVVSTSGLAPAVGGGLGTGGIVTIVIVVIAFITGLIFIFRGTGREI